MLAYDLFFPNFLHLTLGENLNTTFLSVNGEHEGIPIAVLIRKEHKGDFAGDHRPFRGNPATPVSALRIAHGATSCESAKHST